MKKLFTILLPLLALCSQVSAQNLVTRRTASGVPYANANIQLRYSANLVSSYSARTLVDMNYVDSSASAAKRYTVLLTQSGTAAPTVDTLQNTVGAIVWGRTSAGLYTATLTGAFTNLKTFFTIQNNQAVDAVYKLVRTSANVLTLTTYSNGLVADALLSGTPLKVEVYH